MPRFVSLVTGFASSGAATGPTQTLRTPLTGARKLSRLPSGLIRALALSGLPKSIFLGMSPVLLPVGVGSAENATDASRPRPSREQEARDMRWLLRMPTGWRFLTPI